MNDEMKQTLKQLSPENQSYFMELVKVAAVAEDAVKNQQTEEKRKEER